MDDNTAFEATYAMRSEDAAISRNSERRRFRCNYKAYRSKSFPPDAQNPVFGWDSGAAIVSRTTIAARNPS